jgi:hypothetical protein
MTKVFLGGTCNGSLWRNRLIPMLNISYFNPVVEDWTEDCKKKELEERKNSEFNLYVLTPLMTGVYSVAELIDDSNKQPNKTLFCILTADIAYDNKRIIFQPGVVKSLKATADLALANGAKQFFNLEEIATFLNK